MQCKAMLSNAKPSNAMPSNAKNVEKLILEKKISLTYTKNSLTKGVTNLTFSTAMKKYLTCLHKKRNLTKRVTNLTFQLQYKSAKKVKCRSVSWATVTLKKYCDGRTPDVWTDRRESRNSVVDEVLILEFRQSQGEMISKILGSTCFADTSK